MKAIDYLENLIKFRTVEGNNSEFKKCWEYIDSVLLKEKISYIEFERNNHKSRLYLHEDNILKDIKDFDLIIYGNIDVVDGPEIVFEPKIKEDKIYGRGAMDMKFATALSIEIFNKLPIDILRKKIAFLITSDEELGGRDGADYIVNELGYRTEAIIGPNGMIGDNKFHLEIQSKGTIHTKYFTEGKAAHGSRPWEGENAIDKLLGFYNELRSHYPNPERDLWERTLNLGKIEGGFATNAVADEAFMQIDFRYRDQKDRKEYYKIENRLREKYDINKELIVDAFNVEIDENNKIFQIYKDQIHKYLDNDKYTISKAHGSNDIREFYKVGAIPLLLMPRGGGNHTDTEWINLNDLNILYNINRNFILEYFKLLQ